MHSCGRHPEKHDENDQNFTHISKQEENWHFHQLTLMHFIDKCHYNTGSISYKLICPKIQPAFSNWGPSANHWVCFLTCMQGTSLV